MKPIVFPFAVALVACNTEPPPPSAQVPPEPTAPRTGLREHHMEHCPSAVAGAITHMHPTPDGLELTITAGDREGAQQIVDRAAYHAAIVGVRAGRAHHDGRHSGPESIGYCPILHVGTAITVSDVPGGVRVHVRALDPAGLAALRAETAARVDALALASS